MNDKESNNSYHDADEEQPLKASLLNSKNWEESKKQIDFNVDEEDAVRTSSTQQKGEPPSHAEAKSLCEKLFPKLAEGTKLTPEELEVFY